MSNVADDSPGVSRPEFDPCPICGRCHLYWHYPKAPEWVDDESAEEYESTVAPILSCTTCGSVE